ncbi:transporter [Pseudomonas aeruginosa]|nr:transporter [Pseudomonas aeruginosa]
MPLAKLSLPTLALCVGLLGACSPTPRQPRAAPIVPANGPTFGASWTTGNSSSPTRCCDR